MYSAYAENFGNEKMTAAHIKRDAHRAIVLTEIPKSQNTIHKTRERERNEPS